MAERDQGYGRWVHADSVAPGVTRAATTSITAPEFRTRGAIASLMPHAQVEIVPGSHGGFNRINALNDRIAAFIKAHATSRRTAQPADRIQPPGQPGAGSPDDI
jgi:hypothetical protein